MAAALIPAAPALGAGGSGDGPDAELIELGRAYQATERAIDAADLIVDAYHAQEPKPRDAMRHRIEDHVCGFDLPLGPGTPSLSADLKYSPLYSDDEIEQLSDWSADRPPAELARVTEILAEWERWEEECCALADEMGVYEALDVIEDLVPKRRALAKRIAGISATTLAGLQVRATILADMLDQDGDECTDTLMIRAIIRDLLAMATA